VSPDAHPLPATYLGISSLRIKLSLGMFGISILTAFWSGWLAYVVALAAFFLARRPFSAEINTLTTRSIA
jgi:hypothetical protein